MKIESKIYTKMGDDGKTSLVNNVRVSKSSPRVRVYGTIDELNSWLGHSLSELKKNEIDRRTIDFLISMQRKLFDFGSLLACEKYSWDKFNLRKVGNKDIVYIEKEIDFLSNKVPPLKYFILSGGCEAASRIGLARTICRKLERELVSFYDSSPAEEEKGLVIFINRLSDYLFVCSRHINFVQQYEEILMT